MKKQEKEKRMEENFLLKLVKMSQRGMSISKEEFSEWTRNFGPNAIKAFKMEDSPKTLTRY